MSNTVAIRGSVLTFKDDPFKVGDDKAALYIKDGLVIVEDGKISEVGAYQDLENKIPKGIKVQDRSDDLITAGFIDTHVHYPQTPMIAAFGEQLLDWLNQYTFPTEAKFKDRKFAKEVAQIFLRETLKAGTTTSVVYGTVFPQSVDEFFKESERLNTRMIAGKVLMDRNAPEEILDTPETGYRESKELIEKWHNKGRQLYCITPRFAPTCTSEQLGLAGKLYHEYPDVYLQTHLCENKGEIEWVKELFPDCKSYADVYEKHNMMGPRTIYGHCVHFTEEDFQLMHDRDASISHCPTSNFFLGSGLFDLKAAKDQRRPVRTGIGTDIGAGTSLSQLQTLNEAYKVAQLRGNKLTAIQSYYLATRGSAESIQLENKIGSLEKGFEADIVVWDMKSSDLIEFREKFSKDWKESLFNQLIMADDRSVRETYVYGQLVYNRDKDYFLTEKEQKEKDRILKSA